MGNKFLWSEYNTTVLQVEFIQQTMLNHASIKQIILKLKSSLLIVSINSRSMNQFCTSYQILKQLSYTASINYLITSKIKDSILWRDFLSLGKNVKPETNNIKSLKSKSLVNAALSFIQVELLGIQRLACLVMSNLSWSIKAGFNHMAGTNIELQEKNDRVVSYLPLSHIAGLAFDLISHVNMGSRLYFRKTRCFEWNPCSNTHMGQTHFIFGCAKSLGKN